MPATILWSLTMTATSSIAHSGITKGTTTLLRRETIIQPDGHPVQVPVISGNSFRGRLRRIGEELLRDTLDYEGALSLSAAHALRGGGSLAKTSGEPLSGQRLHTLRTHVPHVGVFGCAAGGRIIDGCLQVGKAVPHLTETAHILNPAPTSTLSAFSTTQIETYMRRDESGAHACTELMSTHQVNLDATGQPALAELPTNAAAPSQLMQFHVETLPAGTQFSSWLRLERATDLEVAFFTDVLAAFAADGRLGGRAAIGHGHVRTEHSSTRLAGPPPTALDWRATILAHREDTLTALAALR
jgi:hypothetical protein